MRRVVAAVVAVVAVAALAGGCSGTGEPGAQPSATPSGTSSGTPSGTPTGAPSGTPSPDALPLAGRVVVLDPGHQLGNARFGAQIGASVDAGGFRKACNTTGTATAGGYPEATFTWEVTQATARVLRRWGARVLLTREDNSADAWGPCVDERGRVGNPDEPGPSADVRVSVHGDGNTSPTAHGFHVIAPGERAGWTDDIAVPSQRLATVLRDALVAAGFAPSTYLGEDGLDVRTDLGTLNHSDVPAVLAELGNMRHDGDAAAMTSPQGQRRYARALAEAIRVFLAP